MWAIRFLNGKLAGQEIPLQEGKYILGRSEDCQITIPDSGISKKHVSLEVDEQGVIINDLKSSNGTFLNGVKIQESEIHSKDKVSIYNTTFDIVKAKTQQPLPTLHTVHHQHPETQAPQVAAPYYGYPQQQHVPQPMPPPGHTPQMTGDNISQPVKPTLKNWFTNYLDKVVLPGIYKLPVVLEFKWVIASFLIFFIVMMTFLSAFPLIKILNSSVAQESMNHAESIATTLARMNHESIKNNMHSNINVEYALRRPGVSKAFIISAANGKIIAPPEQAHTYSKMPFVNEGRRKDKASIKKNRFQYCCRYGAHPVS